MNILFIGDIIGKVGRKTVASVLASIIKKEGIDFVIANGECANDKGMGIDPNTVKELISMGINCITSGEKVWSKKEINKFLSSNPSSLLRPLNYPPGIPGLGSFVYSIDSYKKVGIINLLGRAFLVNIDCPFRIGKEEIKKISELTNIIIVDFHAQATAEKQAFGWWVDGEVSAVLGTHTKVQTRDERILHRGTGYITDVGMTGPQDGICGIKKELYIEYFLKGIPIEFEPAGGRGIFCGIILEIDDKTGKAVNIRRIRTIA
jgi:hypothetical protein